MNDSLIQKDGHGTDEPVSRCSTSYSEVVRSPNGRSSFPLRKFPWDVARLPGEVKDDRQAVANGYVHEVMHPGGTGIRLIAAPAQFDEFRRANLLGPTAR